MNLADLVAALQHHLHASLYWAAVWLAAQRGEVERGMARLKHARHARRAGQPSRLARPAYPSLPPATPRPPPSPRSSRSSAPNTGPPLSAAILVTARLLCLLLRGAEAVLAAIDAATPYLPLPLLLAVAARALAALPSYTPLTVANYAALVVAVYLALDAGVRFVPPHAWPAALLPEGRRPLPVPLPPHTLTSPGPGERNKGSLASRRRRTIPTIRIDTAFIDERPRLKRRLRRLQRGASTAP